MRSEHLPVVRNVWAMLALCAATTLSACAGDTPTSPRSTVLNAETGYWSLSTNHKAVTLATLSPYDTIRLVAVPLNAKGMPISGLATDSVATVYTIRDPSDTNFTVDTAGVVHAFSAGTGDAVIIRTTVRGLTRADTIPVNITNTVPPSPAATLTLHVTPDSLTDTFLNGPETGTISVQASDAHGNIIPGIAVAYSAADPRLVMIHSAGGTTGQVLRQPDTYFLHPGSTFVYAEATVYGVTTRDSALVTVTIPGAIALTAFFVTPKSVGTPIGYFEPAVDTVKIFPDAFAGTGATIAFLNATQTPIDVVFDDSSAVQGSGIDALFCGTSQSGNIPAFIADPTQTCFLAQNGYQLRLITVPGTYHYHSALYGTSGTIVVVP